MRLIRRGHRSVPIDTASLETKSEVYGPGIVRAVTALLMVIALVADVLYTQSRLNDNPQASAIQIIQVYAESIFYGLVAVGLGVAGYIFSRAFPD